MVNLSTGMIRSLCIDLGYLYLQPDKSVAARCALASYCNITLKPTIASSHCAKVYVETILDSTILLHLYERPIPVPAGPV